MWALALAVRPGTMWALAALALVALGDRPGQDYHSFYHSGRSLATVPLGPGSSGCWLSAYWLDRSCSGWQQEDFWLFARMNWHL